MKSSKLTTTSRIMGLAFLFLTFFAFQSCFTLRHGGYPVDESIELTNANNETVSQSFRASKKVHHFVYGLVSPDDAGLEELISRQIKLAKGRKAVNVRITYQQKFVDGLVNGLTFGIYNPFTLTVEGDIVR